MKKSIPTEEQDEEEPPLPASSSNAANLKVFRSAERWGHNDTFKSSQTERDRVGGWEEIGTGIWSYDCNMNETDDEGSVEDSAPGQEDRFRQLAHHLIIQDNEYDPQSEDYATAVERLSYECEIEEHVDKQWRRDLAWGGGHISPYQDFCIMSANEAIKLSIPVPKYQDIPPSYFIPENKSENEPVLFIFISHRWETPLHPDPSGGQWQAIQRLLQAVYTLAKASRYDDCTKRISLVPSLKSQLMFFAAHILGLLCFHTGGTLDVDCEQSSPESFATYILSKIGIFYDYCCMPQKPRSEEDDCRFHKMLKQMHGLIARATVIALRSQNDDYGRRAWCVFEDGARSTYTLTMDIEELDFEIKSKDLSVVPDLEEWERDGSERLIRRLDRWEKPGRDVSIPNYYGYSGRSWDFFGDVGECVSCLQPVDRKSLPQLIASRESTRVCNQVCSIAEAKLVLILRLLQAIDGMEWDEFLSENHSIVDFAEIMETAFLECELQVTNEKDIYFVGCLICVATNGTQFRSIWGRLAVLAAEGKSLQLPVKWLSNKAANVSRSRR